MKKLYPLLFISVLIYWGCDDPKEEETTPTEVTLWGVVYSVEDTDTLYLYNNQVTGVIPPEIGNLTNLTYLSLWDNELSGEIPSEIGNLMSLQALGLSWNQLSGEIPSEIGNLTNLTRLYLHENQLTGSIPPEIGNLTNLDDLFLSNNQLTGEIPESICDLNIDWGSGYFNISNNQLCPPYPSCIEDYVGTQDTSDCD
jgi:Leucine-rich repeat (LRR) protein